jgi:hypothetical protein
MQLPLVLAWGGFEVIGSPLQNGSNQLSQLRRVVRDHRYAETWELQSLCCIRCEVLRHTLAPQTMADSKALGEEAVQLSICHHVVGQLRCPNHPRSLIDYPP